MRAGTIALPEGVLETAWWGPGPDQAPTLVLLHEGLGCVALWRDVPEQLAAATGWGVFAYSRFGYGQSDPTALPRPMDYMQQEAQTVLPRVLAAAGIERAVLVGHSDGGSIATVYAGAYPAQSVTMPGAYVSRPGPGLAEPATGGNNDGGVMLLGLITIAAHFFVEDLNIASIERIRQDYDTGDLRPRLARYHRDVDMAFQGWNDAWLDPRFRGFDITDFLPAIRVPILAVQGADDPYGSQEQLHVMQARVHCPIDIEVIPGAHHAPHLEARARTLSIITRFVARLPEQST